MPAKAIRRAFIRTSFRNLELLLEVVTKEATCGVAAAPLKEKVIPLELARSAVPVRGRYSSRLGDVRVTMAVITYANKD